MGTNFIPYKLALRLEIDEKIIYDVVSINATFELNGIPSASVEVAAGTSLKDGSSAKAETNFFDNIKLRTRARVLMDVIAGDVDNSALSAIIALPPGKDYVIFDGYYIGTGWVRTREQARFRVHLIHWIDDLNCSSMINGNYVPGMPADLAQAAVNISWSLIADNNIAGISQTAAITDANIAGDLWSDNIKKVFLRVANLPHFKQQRLGPPLGNETKNDAALAALARMPGDDSSNKADLRLKIQGDLQQATLTTSFRKTLTEMIKNNMGQTSFWGKLIGEFCPEFLIAVAPAAERADVIPFFGGLNRPWVVINANDYTTATFNCAATNLIESVNLFHSMRNEVGITLTGEKPETAANITPNFYAPFGEYPAAGQTEKRGFIMVKKPPRWLANGSPEGGIVKRTSDALQDTHTGNRNPGRSPPGGEPSSPEAQASLTDVANNFCEHWYKTAVLAQRQGELSGKLRFDIAPGSIVKILLPATSSDAAKVYFAAVMSVSYVIDAEKAMSGTSFTLTAMRTEKENNDPTLTSSASPLYQGRGWSGGTLINFTP